MAEAWRDPQSTPALIPDPGHSLRCWTAGFLRVGIGLTLLSSGLTDYFGRKNAIGPGSPWGPGFLSGGLDPLASSLPYLAIGLGLALIVGFLTTAASIAAAFFSLLPLVFGLISVISTGPQMPNRGFGQFMSIFLNASVANLIPYALMIWLSPLENHPISIDSLIFGRNEFEQRPILAPTTEAMNGPLISIDVDRESSQSSG